MLRKVAPYAPYLLVIASLVVAIILVLVFQSGDKKSSHHDQKHKDQHKTQTAGSATKAANGPTYKVRTAPESPKKVADSVSTSKSTSTAKASTVAASAGTEKLADSGPKETIAVFVASVILFAGLHSAYIRKNI